MLRFEQTGVSLKLSSYILPSSDSLTLPEIKAELKLNRFLQQVSLIKKWRITALLRNQKIVQSYESFKVEMNFVA